MRHYLGSLLPYNDGNTEERTAPKFAQIYIVDPDMQRRAERRRGIFADLDPVALLDIEQMMQTHNPFAQQFLTFGEKVQEHNANEVVDVVFRLHEKASNPRTYNLPTVSEVGATMIEDGNLEQPRDLLLYTRQRRLLRLFETNSMYDPLQYPILLPYGELGWIFTDTYEDGAVRRGKNEMSLREHVAYRLYQKADDESALHQGGRLFQQYCVDQRAKCEQEQLRWVATHQKEIRADLYRGIQDALLSETTIQLSEGERLVSEYDRGTGDVVHPDRRRRRHFLDQVGKIIILPSSHSGSPRQMYQSYLDSMAMVQVYGKPDLFITMTTSPTWEEIKEKLPEGQTAQDRPDIVARVWQQKLAAFLKDLDEGVLGHVVARIYVVEFQKRDLPHAHILIIMKDDYKPGTRENIDQIVSSELPDREANPELFETVMTCMMHGPCGAAHPRSPCRKDGKCMKGYQKPLVEVTRRNENGFPVYRRRRRAAGVLKFKGREFDNFTVNRWVVPYNPYLSQKYNCHINVEVCTEITAVKYLYKYVYKGSDKAMITLETVNGDSNRREPNEIIRYLNARYISPVEACMRLLDYSVQGKTHAVIQLPVHLENEQVVIFRSTDDPNRLLTRGSRTKLTAFFELCSSEHADNQLTKTTKYQDVPKSFKWNDKRKVWERRKRYQAALGRMIHVSPMDKERFYMRVLLTYVRGPKSFVDLRTVDGHVFPTYHDAALERRLLESDSEWKDCMKEVADFQMPYQLRQLFAILLVYANVAEVRALWDEFYEALSNDFTGRFSDKEGQEKEDLVKFNTLKSLNEFLHASGMDLEMFQDLPQLEEFPNLLDASLQQNNLIRREMEYNHSELQDIVDHEHRLNQGQQTIYNEVMQAVERSTAGNKLFFIDGPGGTGNPH